MGKGGGLSGKAVRPFVLHPDSVRLNLIFNSIFSDIYNTFIIKKDASLAFAAEASFAFYFLCRQVLFSLVFSRSSESLAFKLPFQIKDSCCLS